MIREFKAVDMSTIYDVCLNTYGTFNHLVKLMTDNNFAGINDYPVAGQIFLYDDSLVFGLAQQKLNTYKYATREKNPTNIDNMIYYSEDYPYDYRITADGESVISLPEIPVGAGIVRVDLETLPVALTDWGWNATSRVLTLTMNSDPDWEGSRDVYPTVTGQLLSVIYKIKKNTL